MANFANSYVNPQEGSAQVAAPVQDPGISSLLNAGSGILDSIGSMANAAQKNYKEEAKLALKAQIEQANNETLSSFSQDQLKIAEAVEMGDMSSAQARSRMRNNLTTYIANNPQLTQDLGKVHTSVVKSTGLGQAVYEGTVSEKQAQSLQDKAVEAGWVLPSATDDQKMAAASAYAQFQRGIEQMRAEQQQVSLGTAKINQRTAGISQQSAILGLQEKQAQAQSRAALGQVAGAYQVKLGNSFEQIRQAKEQGQITALQADMAIDQAFLEVQQVSAQLGADAGSDYINGMTRGLTAMRDNYKRYVSGDIQLNELKNRNDTAVAIQTDQILGDPQRARLAAVNNIYNNAGPVLFEQMSTQVASLLDNNTNQASKPSDILPDTPEGQADTKTYLNFVTDGMKKSQSAGVDNPELYRQQLDTNISKIFKGLEVYGPNSSNSTSYNNVVDFLADPAFGKYVAKNGVPDEASAYKAGQVLEYEYVNKALPLIKSEWENTKTGGTPEITYYGRTEQVTMKDQQATPQLIQPKFVGSGVTFVAQGGVGNSITQRKVRELNEKVAPVLNRLVRMTAHLEGSVDYRGIYEGRFAGVFEEATPEGK